MRSAAERTWTATGDRDILGPRGLAVRRPAPRKISWAGTEHRPYLTSRCKPLPPCPCRIRKAATMTAGRIARASAPPATASTE